MDKKTILAIFIIIIMIAVVGVFAYNHFIPQKNDNQLKIGESSFILPEGFKETASNSDFKNITNGEYTFFIKECGNDNITKYVKQYKKQLERNNKTFHSSKFDVNGSVVYKVIVNETQTPHYWFTINGTVYTCYTWGDQTKMETYITDLIKTST